jgi:hypothetical protein
VSDKARSEIACHAGTLGRNRSGGAIRPETVVRQEWSEKPVVNALRDALVRRLVANAATFAGGLSWGLALMPWQQILDSSDFVTRGRAWSDDENSPTADGDWRIANTNTPLWVWWSS